MPYYHTTILRVCVCANVASHLVHFSLGGPFFAEALLLHCFGVVDLLGLLQGLNGGLDVLYSLQGRRNLFFCLTSYQAWIVSASITHAHLTVVGDLKWPQPDSLAQESLLLIITDLAQFPWRRKFHISLVKHHKFFFLSRFLCARHSGMQWKCINSRSANKKKVTECTPL